MWAEIITFIIEAIVENSFIKGIESIQGTKKRASFKKAMQTRCNKLLKKYDDTSLDCGDFHKYIQSIKFNDFLFRFFNLSYDGLSTVELIDFFVNDAHIAAPTCSNHELREFFKSFDVLYRDYLHKIISEDVSLSALWSLISLSNRTFYQKVYESEESIKRYMDSYFSPKLLDESPDLKKYHEICVNEFSKICFTGIAGAETKGSRNIEELYVENQFLIISDLLTSRLKQGALSKKRKTSYTRDSTFSLLNNASEIFNFSNRIVLVGGAGYGKTTTVNYLFCKYAEIFGHDILRIKINLKDYANQLDNKDITDCLVDEVSKRTTFSKSKNIKSTVADYLESGNAMIIFDALDEIPSEYLREKARLEISRFVDVYYLNKFIITTREVGYLRNKFEDNFLHIRICPFNDDQIKRYASMWYSLRQVGEEKQGNFNEFYKHFAEEANRSKCFEIIRNPIILVLALIIFDTENNLPHKRVEFYKKCIDTFLNTREERKNAFTFTEKAKCILGDNSIIPKVAYYRYNELLNDKEYKLTKAELNKSIFTALEINDRSSWIDAVNIFTQYLVERTELIREIDEDTFDFSHKTFGEYFLACYFANSIENSELVNSIKEWIGDPNKDELANLVIEVVIQQNQAQQHAAVINMIFNEVSKISEDYPKENNQKLCEKMSEKLKDFTRILFNIVNSGMLIPKFTDKFYELLIDYPNLLRRIPGDRSDEGFYSTLPCPIDFDHYIALSAKKYFADNDLTRLIHRYYCVCRIQMPEKDKISCILKSFSGSHNLPDGLLPFLSLINTVLIKEETLPDDSEPNGINVDEIIGIFKNTPTLFSSPEAFLSILFIVCNYVEYSKLFSQEFLCNFNFEKNNLFARFIFPQTLTVLLSNSLENCDWFALNLLSFSKCVDSSAFFFLDWLNENGITGFRNDRIEVNSEEVNKAEGNAALIKTMFAYESLDSLVEKLKELSVYSPSYANIYSDCFSYMRKYYNANSLTAK